jgi:hypothetical protein
MCVALGDETGFVLDHIAAGVALDLVHPLEANSLVSCRVRTVYPGSDVEDGHHLIVHGSFPHRVVYRLANVMWFFRAEQAALERLELCVTSQDVRLEIERTQKCALHSCIENLGNFCAFK